MAVMLGHTAKQKNVLLARFQEFNQSLLPSTQKIAILGPGQITAEDDFSQGSKYTCSLQCVSEKGTLYKISKDNFIALLKLKGIKEALANQVYLKNNKLNTTSVAKKCVTKDPSPRSSSPVEQVESNGHNRLMGIRSRVVHAQVVT
jgi:CRP-like cAMP-binding protein